MTDAPPRLQGLASYAVTMIPLAFAGIPLYILTPDLYTRHLGVSVAAMGVCLLALRLLDGVQDPLIGWLSDRYAQHRAGIVQAGFVLMGIGLGFLYLAPFFIAPLMVFAGGVFLATLGFSCVSINLNVAGSFWHDDEAARARVAAAREAVTLVGIILAVTLPILIIDEKTVRTGMALYALAFFALLGIGAYAFRMFWQRYANIHHGDTGHAAEGPAFRFGRIRAIIMPPYRGYFGLMVLTHLAASFPATLFLFFVNDYLQPNLNAGLFLVLYFLSAALLTPLWGVAVRRLGAPQSWALGMGIAIVTFAGAGFLQPGDVIAFAVICVLSGLALGADLVIPPILLARLIDQRGDHAHASQFFSVLSLLPKLTMGLAAGCALWILGQAGFVPGEVASNEAQSALVFFYAVVPCLIKGASLGFILLIIHRKGSLVHATDKRSHHHGSAVLP